MLNIASSHQPKLGFANPGREPWISHYSFFLDFLFLQRFLWFISPELHLQRPRSSTGRSGLTWIRSYSVMMLICPKLWMAILDLCASSGEFAKEFQYQTRLIDRLENSHMWSMSQSSFSYSWNASLSLSGHTNDLLLYRINCFIFISHCRIPCKNIPYIHEQWNSLEFIRLPLNECLV